MQSESVKTSTFDLVTAILNGKVMETYNASESGELKMLVENRNLLTLFTTSFAVLIGCVIVLVWRKSFTKKSVVNDLQPQKIVVPKKDQQLEIDDGKKKVTIFFGTQTGTAENFAKVKYDSIMKTNDEISLLLLYLLILILILILMRVVTFKITELNVNQFNG